MELKVERVKWACDCEQWKKSKGTKPCKHLERLLLPQPLSRMYGGKRSIPAMRWGSNIENISVDPSQFGEKGHKDEEEEERWVCEKGCKKRPCRHLRASTKVPELRTYILLRNMGVLEVAARIVSMYVEERWTFAQIAGSLNMSKTAVYETYYKTIGRLKNAKNNRRK